MKGVYSFIIIYQSEIIGDIFIQGYLFYFKWKVNYSRSSVVKQMLLQ